MGQRSDEYDALQRRATQLMGRLKWRRKCPRTQQLCRQLEKGQRLLQRSVHSGPLRQRNYRHHQHTYQILLWRVQQLRQHFAQRPDVPVLPSPPATDDADAWLDYADDLEDSVEGLAQVLRAQTEADHLAVIELLDALDRTDPQQAELLETICTPQLLQAIRTLRSAARTYLYRAGVRAIALQVGAYPPVEETRILHEGVEHFDEEIVIAKVVETGYRWGSFVMRPAAVTIASVTKP